MSFEFAPLPLPFEPLPPDLPPLKSAPTSIGVGPTAAMARSTSVISDLKSFQTFKRLPFSKRCCRSGPSSICLKAMPTRIASLRVSADLCSYLWAAASNSSIWFCTSPWLKFHDSSDRSCPACRVFAVGSKCSIKRCQANRPS